MKQLQSPLPLPTTLPLLSASIASTKTVIANPVLYLNNHVHDILYTIVQMKTPPRPSIEDTKVTCDRLMLLTEREVHGYACAACGLNLEELSPRLLPVSLGLTSECHLEVCSLISGKVRSSLRQMGYFGDKLTLQTVFLLLLFCSLK